MAPRKRPREEELEDDLEDDVSSASGGPAAEQSSRKRPRPTEPIRQGPFVMTDSEDDDGESEYEHRATQALRERYTKKVVNIPAENGIIESVHCSNFMCHKNWELKLNPLINFVIGKNGSGKSAALTALILCLGGKASATNRATNLKGFISEGQESATIVVKIKNSGDSGYMHDEYGDTIMVERHFNRSGTSGFKLKSANGRIISTRRADLDDICDFYALQIDNPMNVLSQDNARQFITSSSPQDKYKFFVKGVQLEQLDHDYGVLEETIDNIESKLGTRHEDIAVLKDRRDKAAQRLALSDQHEHLREKVRELRRQHAWAQVEEAEQDRDKLFEELQNHDKFISDAEDEARGYDTRYEKAAQAAELAAQSAHEAHTELQAARDSKVDVKAKFDKDRQTAGDAQTEQREIQQQVKTANKRIADANRDIAAEHQRLADLNGGSHTRRRAEIDEKKGELENLKKEHDDHRDDLARLEQNRDNAEEELKDFDTDLKEKKSDVVKCEQLIQGLQRDRGDISKGYHDRLPTLLRAIQNENSFRERPIGPMGHYIRLKEQKWSPVLESAFGGTLTGFIVTSKSDQTILHRLMQKVGCHSPIFIGATTPLDTAPHEPDANLKTWLRVLEFDNEAVKRQAVIAHSIEQIVLADDGREATKIMASGTRPDKVKQCFYLLGSTGAKSMSYTGGSRDLKDVNVSLWRGPPRMKTDVEQQISYQRENLQRLKRELNEIEAQFRDYRSNLTRAKQAIVRHDRDEKDFQLRLKRLEDEIDALTTELEQDAVEEGRIDALREELQSAEDQKKVAEESYQASVVELDAKRAQMTNSQKELTAKDKEIGVIEARVGKLDDASNKAASKRQTELREKNTAYERISDRQQDRNRAERAYQTQAAKVETEFIGEATKICQRVNVPAGETVSSLDKKLEKLDRDVSRETRRVGDRTELAQNARATHEACTTAEGQVKDLEALAQLLKQALTNRRFRWEKFRHLISARAKVQFMYLLTERGFRGRLVASHKNKILDLMVEPDKTREGKGKGNQPKTLSGGEKSFSQICLLLSLWEAMGSPIRALDEFDVYMDAANRHMSMNLLIGAARRSISRQFIFITPGEGFQKMDNNPDVSFHSLAQPDRGQRTLTFST